MTETERQKDRELEGEREIERKKGRDRSPSVTLRQASRAMRGQAALTKDREKDRE